MFSTSALCASTTSRLPPDQSSPPIDLFVPTLVLRIFCDLATQQTLYSLKRPLSEPAVDTFTQLVNLLDRFQCAPALLERLMQHAQPVIACEPWEMFVIFARLDMVHEARECIRKFATASLPPQAQLRSRYRSNSLTKPHPHLPDCGSQSDWILPHCIPAEEANKIPVAWLLALFKARKSEELEHERQNRQNGGNGGGGGAQNRQRAAIIQPRVSITFPLSALQHVEENTNLRRRLPRTLIGDSSPDTLSSLNPSSETRQPTDNTLRTMTISRQSRGPRGQVLVSRLCRRARIASHPALR